MRKYEIMFIVRPDLEENAVKETVKKLEKVLTDNKAVITLSKELGQKEFAYEIKGFKSGFYYLYNIDTNSDAAVKEFDRVVFEEDAKAAKRRQVTLENCLGAVPVDDKKVHLIKEKVRDNQNSKNG